MIVPLRCLNDSTNVRKEKDRGESISLSFDRKKSGVWSNTVSEMIEKYRRPTEKIINKISGQQMIQKSREVSGI